MKEKHNTQYIKDRVSIFAAASATLLLDLQQYSIVKP